VAGRIQSVKNFKGSMTHDFPFGSAVSEPTALPSAPDIVVSLRFMLWVGIDLSSDCRQISARNIDLPCNRGFINFLFSVFVCQIILHFSGN